MHESKTWIKFARPECVYASIEYSNASTRLDCQNERRLHKGAAVLFAEYAACRVVCAATHRISHRAILPACCLTVYRLSCTNFLTNLKNCIQDLNVKFCFSTCSIRDSRKCTHYVRVGPVRALIHGIHVNHLLLLLDSDRFASLACSYL
jgi:hypothetical protein